MPKKPIEERAKWRWDDGAYYGYYWDLKKDHQAKPPKLVLTDNPRASELQLKRLWVAGKRKKAEQLGIDPEAGPLFSQISNKYLEEFVRVEKEWNTFIAYRQSHRYWLEANGDHEIDKVTIDEKLEFNKVLKQHCPGGGKRVHQKHMRIFFKWALKHDLLQKPVYIDVDAEGKHLIEIFSVKEIEKYKEFLHSLNHPYLLRIFYLTYYAILRCDEAAFLPLHHINLKTNTIKIKEFKLNGEKWKPKQNLPREIKIENDVLLEFIDDEMYKFNPNAKWWTDTGNGNRYWGTSNNVSQAFSRLKRKTDLPDIDMLQALRRSGISHMAQAGEPLQNVHRLAGHKTMETTNNYYLALDAKEASVSF